MRYHIQSFAALMLAIVVTCSAYAEKNEVEIFNGEDFSGWTKRGGDATYRIEDGVIIGRSKPNTPNTFMATNEEYGDFILELDFKIDPNNFNSGVQIRSHSRPENGGERVYGYQVEIDTDPKRPWSGGIYYEGGKKDDEGNWVRRAGWLDDLRDNPSAQQARKLGEWNHLKVKAEGRRIQTWLNGVPGADFTDTDDEAFAPKGFIALQVHSVGESRETKEVRWKNIQLTVLE